MRNTFLYKALFFLTLMAWPAFAEAKDDPKAIQATASSLLDQEKYDESYPYLVDLERLYSRNGTNYQKAYLEFLYGKYCYGKTFVSFKQSPIFISQQPIYMKRKFPVGKIGR